ncbi:hypothetical protein DFH06DRAFT_1317962 [Mycena polygramma]|nr:hypothetical protein DFH06DRAFT_1317962 [Mycena polygramma]
MELWNACQLAVVALSFLFAIPNAAAAPLARRYLEGNRLAIGSVRGGTLVWIPQADDRDNTVCRDSHVISGSQPLFHPVHPGHQQLYD